MSDVEVDINTGTSNKVVIEGKTSVPFRTFVTLVLQRKVQALFKASQDEPVIVGSELLTKLASAPEDKHEDRSKLVLVTFGVGILAGIFIAAAIVLILSMFQVQLRSQDLLIVLGVIGLVAILGFALQRSRKRNAFTEKLTEAMEKTTDLFSR